MNATIEKPLDYRCFLLGIIVYWMLVTTWAAVNPLFFLLEGVLNPIAVVIGENILFLLVFYFLFRSLKKFEIKWIHVAILLGFLVVMSVFEYFIVENVVDFGFVAENRMEHDISNHVLRNVRRWTGLVSRFIIIVFLWWHFNSEDTATEKLPLEYRSCCGGMLFTITFKSILYACCGIGGSSWAFVPHPILEEVITYFLLALFTVGSIYLLVKNYLLVLPQAAILAIVVLHFFTANYLFNILQKHLVMNLDTIQHVAFFDNVANCCNWVFFLVAYVLYRKELEKPKE
jgi:hypothetical protein